jgi:hypothetical protein
MPVIAGNPAKRPEAGIQKLTRRHSSIAESVGSCRAAQRNRRRRRARRTWPMWRVREVSRVFRTFDLG